MGAAQSGPLSGSMRVAIAAGYTILLAVNGIFGSGAFGVPTNAEVSDAYPTNVTPVRCSVNSKQLAYAIDAAPDSLVDLRTGAEAIANGAVKGQVHFFPAICNAKQITDEFARRGCGKL